MHMTLPPFDDYDDSDVEFAMLPEELKRELQVRWDSNAVGEPCCWLDLETKRCRHYEHRPVVCSRFEPGGEICREDREAVGLEPS